VDLPASLPSRLYLLAYDTDKHRLTGRGQLGVALRAAALTELLHSGHITEADGKPKVAATRVTDPVLDDVVQEIAQSRPRSWAHWVGRRDRAAFRAVQERLADSGYIRVEPRRILGIFPTSRVTVREPRVVRRLRDTVNRTLTGGVPVARLDRADAALAALAAVGEVRVAVGRRQAHEHKRRLAELTEVAGPAVPALRKVIQWRQAAAAGG
jgi:hypothetical protein